ncbi:MAG: 4-alpha-glucanotransferase [Solirubrobacteraceae bacterium]
MRSSGVQLHVTSLPGGRLGAEAHRFVDWLASAGQSWWQLLPLHPPDRYRSPYRPASAFAAWRGLLASPRAPVTAAQIADFRERRRFWIGDWERFAGRGAVADQVRFEREWGALREHAAACGVRLLGDVAIYVARGSCDHRMHPELFRAGAVAGAPPDAYSSTGQRWGNPLYDWPAMRRRRYRWWVERIRRTLELFDLVRLDHFRGFVSYWAVPEHARTAVGGTWQRGPGMALFRALERELAPPGTLPLVAEDLGVITPAVERLRDELGLPGMVVLQFGFDPEDPDSPHRPANHLVNRVVYTGTHDQDTTRGWLQSLAPPSRALLDAELAQRGLTDRRRPWWGVIRLAFASPARIAIVQAQDLLGLGSEARMNVPGRAGTAWRWRLERRALTPALARRLREATEEAGRLPQIPSRGRKLAD